MKHELTNRQKPAIVGVLILAAYSMLTYSMTENIVLGLVMDIISGLAVIGIALIMYPIFAKRGNKALNLAYMISRGFEGVAMILGGFFLLSPGLRDYRNMIYVYIHIYFFIAGALFFYLLLYQSRVIPKFISVWGIAATVALTVMTLGEVVGITSSWLTLLILPIILNELFLAIWLMIKGFREPELQS